MNIYLEDTSIYGLPHKICIIYRKRQKHRRIIIKKSDDIFGAIKLFQVLKEVVCVLHSTIYYNILSCY